jgi:phosphoribosylformimino-5-aminoimidazole carboxamide ribonucleotide (ProFAR) isomerase
MLASSRCRISWCADAYASRVTFEIIPAIDIARGRLVRLSGGEVEPIQPDGGNPVAAAARFVDAGATRLHVVDVDLATTGAPANLEHLASIAALGVPVQGSGGVTTRGHVDAFIDAGAERVVLGSAAFANRTAAEELIETCGDRLCVGIEADGSTIRPRNTDHDLALWDTLQWLEGLDVARFVFTDVRRDSAGPDLDGVWALAMHTGKPVLASGGVRSIDDLRAIASLGGTVEGAIVGRALHERLDLAEARRAVAG